MTVHLNLEVDSSRFRQAPNWKITPAYPENGCLEKVKDGRSSDAEKAQTSTSRSMCLEVECWDPVHEGN